MTIVRVMGHGVFLWWKLLGFLESVPRRHDKESSGERFPQSAMPTGTCLCYWKLMVRVRSAMVSIPTPMVLMPTPIVQAIVRHYSPACREKSTIYDSS